MFVPNVPPTKAQISMARTGRAKAAVKSQRARSMRGFGAFGQDASLELPTLPSYLPSTEIPTSAAQIDTSVPSVVSTDNTVSSASPSVPWYTTLGNALGSVATPLTTVMQKLGITTKPGAAAAAGQPGAAAAGMSSTMVLLLLAGGAFLLFKKR
jgi:hypothetical protein